MFAPRPLIEILVRLGVLFKISDDHPCHFYLGAPPGGGGGNFISLCKALQVGDGILGHFVYFP